MTTASALAFAAVGFAALCLCPSPGAAQEGERPFGLFDRIFGGSERLVGAASAPRRRRDRTAQMSGPDHRWCASIGWRRRSGSSPASSSSCSTEISNSRPTSAACRRMNRQARRARRALRATASARPRNPFADDRGDARQARRRLRSEPAIRMRRALRKRSARSARQPARRPPAPIWRRSAGRRPGGRGAGAPLDLATMSPPGGPPPATRAAIRAAQHARRCRRRKRRGTNSISPTATCCARIMRSPRTASAIS